MTATPHTQSLADFRRAADETLDRLNATGEAEVLTVDGVARAVLVTPSAYDDLAREAEEVREAQLELDVEVIRRSMRDIDEGRFRSADEFFDELHAKLLAMKARQEAEAAAQAAVPR